MAKAYAKEQCGVYGWSEDDYNSLVQLWEKESGWNVAAGDLIKHMEYLKRVLEIKWHLAVLIGRLII